MRNSAYKIAALTAGLALGNLANPSEAYAQQNGKVAKDQYTEAGNDVGLLNSYVNQVNLSSKIPYKFNLPANATDIVVRDAKDGVDGLVERLDDKYYLASNNKDFRAYWKKVARTVERSDGLSIIQLNRALVDGTIEPSEIMKDGKYQIKEGMYWVGVRVGFEEKGMLVYFTLPESSNAKPYSVPGVDTTKSGKQSTVKTTGTAPKANATVAKKDSLENRSKARPSAIQSKPRIQPVPPRYVLKSTADSAALTNAYNAVKREQFVKDSVYNTVKDSVHNAQAKDSVANFQKDSIAKASASTSSNDSANTKVVKSPRFPMRLTVDYSASVAKVALGTDVLAHGGRVGIGGGFLGPFSLTGSYMNRNDVNAKRLAVPLSNGRTGVGSEDFIDYNSKSIGLELKLGPILAGAEKEFDNYTRKISEDIVSAQGNSLAPVTNFIPGKAEATNFHVGLDMWRLRLLAEKDTKNRLSASAGLRFGRSNKRK